MSVRNPLRSLTLCVLVGIFTYPNFAVSLQAADSASALAAIRQVAPEGVGHSTAMAAVKNLSQLDAQALPEVLAAMDGANPLAKNWLFGVAGTLADRGNLPTAALEAYFEDRQHDADARYWVFQLLTKDSAAERAARMEQLLEDPSAELKYLAVEHHLKQVDSLREAGDQQSQLNLLARLLEASRNPPQIQKIAGLLKEVNQPVELQKHFGFIAQWHVVGPFDNVGQKAFDVVYGPEQELIAGSGKALDLSAMHAGKAGEVTWKLVSTDKEDGTVDLNVAYNNEKGAICYAFSIFNSTTAQACEVRLGCTNANQLWLNGKKLISNEVYHTASAIDQYTARGELRAGPNTILLKICQNEQTEQWAQDFAFQFRVTDLTGKAIRSVE